MKSATPSKKRKRNPPPKPHRSWEDYAEMGDGCLDMVRVALERLGCSMRSTPPMFYDDAVMCAVFRRRKDMVDALELARLYLEDGATEDRTRLSVVKAIKAALHIKSVTDCK